MLSYTAYVLERVIDRKYEDFNCKLYVVFVEFVVGYLCSLSLVYNDLNPNNSMLDGSGIPVIAAIGSCRSLPGTSHGGHGGVGRCRPAYYLR